MRDCSHSNSGFAVQNPTESSVSSKTRRLASITIDPLIEKYALENTYDLYFLTYIDTPWEADDLRDKPHERERMFKAFEEALKTSKKPYVLLKGSLKERLDEATKHIDLLLKNKK